MLGEDAEFDWVSGMSSFVPGKVPGHEDFFLGSKSGGGELGNFRVLPQFVKGPGT
jgi:hypothetical protein